MRNLTNTPYLFTAAAMAAGMLAACGSDDTCESASAAICKRACDCTDGPGCQVQDGTTIAIFADESECLAFYEDIVCVGSGEFGVDWGACRAAASEARCVPLDDGSQAALSPVACGSDPPPVDAGPVDASPIDAPAPATVLEQGEQNWALMSGPVVPGQNDDIGGNRKQIPVAETDLEDRFTLGGFYILRLPADSESSDFIVSVRNDGADAVCFVAINVTMRDAGGSSLGSTFTYVHGSVSHLDSAGNNTDTCLQPDEKGYVSSFVAIPFDDIARADVAVEFAPFDTLPEGVILPFDYRFELDRLVADMKNHSDTPLSVPFGTWVLLDDDDAPLSGGLFTHFDDPVSVAPGAEASITSELPFGALATGRKLWVQNAFQNAATAARQADPRMALPAPPRLRAGRVLTAGERERWYQVQRNQREAHKRSLLRNR